MVSMMVNLLETESPTIEYHDGIAHINGLKLKNPDTVELLQRTRPEEVRSLVDSLLATVSKVAKGATTAELMVKEFREEMRGQTREEFEGFRREIESRLGTFNKEINKDIENTLSSAFKELKEQDENIAEKVNLSTKEIKEILENKISERLQKKLEEIDKKIVLEKKEEEIKHKTTLKGLEFQDAVFEECRALLESSEEVADFVGNSQGSLRKKTGDILVHHTLNNKVAPSTVIECKDKDLSGSGKAKDILAEIEESLANRNAEACLYLFKSQEQMPESFSPLKVGERFIVASAETELWLLLKMAKLVGGIECRLNNGQEGADIEAARRELEKIPTYAGDLEEIQRLSSLIGGHSENIHKKAGEVRGRMESSVYKALQYLAESGG